MTKRLPVTKSPTMIIPRGTEIQVDVHGQLNVSTPGNLVIENSGNFGVIESVHGSIRIEPEAQVEAVQVQCADVCYVQGDLTAWKVSARSLQLEDQARASIVLQETKELEIGKGARLVGNFADDRELFVLFSRFAEQLRSLPVFGKRDGAPQQVEATQEASDLLVEVTSEIVEPETEATTRPTGELPDPLFFALILLERESSRSAIGPTGKRIIEELIKLLRERDLESLRLTYKTLCGRIVEPSDDLRRAHELMHGHFSQ